MAQGFGNLIPAPGYSYVDEIAHIEILYSTVGLTQKGMTLATGQGVLLAGTLMGQITASKLWVAYDDDGTDDGRRVARGVLRDTVDTTGASYLGNIVLSGMLRNSKIVGADANGIADLNARVDTVLDIFQF